MRSSAAPPGPREALWIDPPWAPGRQLKSPTIIEMVLIHGFLVNRRSSLWGVWAAPGSPGQLANICGGCFAPPMFLQGFLRFWGRTDPKICDLRLTIKACIKNPSVVALLQSLIITNPNFVKVGSRSFSGSGWPRGPRRPFQKGGGLRPPRFAKDSGAPEAPPPPPPPSQNESRNCQDDNHND